MIMQKGSRTLNEHAIKQTHFILLPTQERRAHMHKTHLISTREINYFFVRKPVASFVQLLMQAVHPSA